LTPVAGNAVAPSPATARYPEGECRQSTGLGLLPRLSTGTLQLSIRCSSIHFLPIRSFPVRDGPLAGAALGALWSGCLSCAQAIDAKHAARRETIIPR
jgi:hypothetical protein